MGEAPDIREQDPTAAEEWLDKFINGGPWNEAGREKALAELESIIQKEYRLGESVGVTGGKFLEKELRDRAEKAEARLAKLEAVVAAARKKYEELDGKAGDGDGSVWVDIHEKDWHEFGELLRTALSSLSGTGEGK